MKKIIAFFVLFLAFSTSAMAQSQNKGTTYEMNAKRDYQALAEVMDLTPETQDAVIALLKKKYEGLAQPNMTDESRQQVLQTIENKLKIVLGPEALKKLDEHKSVYKQLVSDSSL